MRKSRFTESQILAVLKEGEGGVAVTELVRKHGISRNTYLKWKAKYAGTTVPELRRLRELEAENAKQKRMYAELALENAAIEDLEELGPGPEERGWEVAARHFRPSDLKRDKETEERASAE